jgi:hypothetical protein
MQVIIAVLLVRAWGGLHISAYGPARRPQPGATTARPMVYRIMGCISNYCDATFLKPVKHLVPATAMST